MTQNDESGPEKSMEVVTWGVYFGDFFLEFLESPSQQCEFIRSIPVADKIFSQRRFKWKFRIGLKRCLFFCQGTISFLVHSQPDAQRDIVNWNLKLPILLWNVKTCFATGKSVVFLSTIFYCSLPRVCPCKGLELTVWCLFLAAF